MDKNKLENPYTFYPSDASNMTVQDYQRRFKEVLPPETVYAAEYLESRGLLLGDDFGTTNAIRKATDMILDELEVDYGI